MTDRNRPLSNMIQYKYTMSSVIVVDCLCFITGINYYKILDRENR